MKPMTIQLGNLIKEHIKEEVAFDVETVGDKAICFSIAWGPNFSDSFGVFVTELTFPIPELDALKAITHYGKKADIPPMRALGQNMRVEIDTYAAARLHYWWAHDGFSLKELAKNELGAPEWGSAADLIAKYGGMDKVPRQELLTYNRWDAVYQWRLWHEVLKPQFEPGSKKYLLMKIESALMHILADMQETGIIFDRSTVDEIRRDLQQELAEAQAKTNALCPGLAGSTPDGQGYLIEKLLGAELIKKLNWPRVKKGRLSINKDVMARNFDVHPALIELHTYNDIKTVISSLDTYASSIGKDGAIHSTFDSFGSSTGRFSSSGPNLQNVSRTSRGKAIRKAFKARPGYCYAAFDFKTIQLVILAVLSKDKKLMEIFSDPARDIHREMGEWLIPYKLYGMDTSKHQPVEITEERRNSMKGINFGKAFNPGYAAAFLGFCEGDWGIAGQFEKLWYQKLPGVRDLHQWVLWEGVKKAYTETFYGRRQPQTPVELRRVKVNEDGKPLLDADGHKQYEEITGREGFRIRARAATSCINHPVQGTEGDIAKIAMTNAWNVLEIQNKVARTQGKPLRGKMLINVHDDTTFELRISDLHRLVKLLRAALTTIPHFPIPVFVDCKVGLSLYDMKKYDPNTDYIAMWESNDIKPPVEIGQASINVLVKKSEDE